VARLGEAFYSLALTCSFYCAFLTHEIVHSAALTYQIEREKRVILEEHDFQKSRKAVDPRDTKHLFLSNSQSLGWNFYRLRHYWFPVHNLSNRSVIHLYDRIRFHL
jgi:hypothetical protein